MPFHELNKFQNRGKYTTKMEITQDYTQKIQTKQSGGGGGDGGLLAFMGFIAIKFFSGRIPFFRKYK